VEPLFLQCKQHQRAGMAGTIYGITQPAIHKVAFRFHHFYH
jgi:hypothetical protein